MQVTIYPSIIKGAIRAAASKSSMQRACAASLLSGAKTIIHNPGHSNDDKAALAVITALGAQIVEEKNDSITIQSHGVRPVNNTVNCGESGLGIRMFAPIVSLSPEQISIEGEGSLLSRPMDFFDEVLPGLGVDIKSNQGKLPLRLRGPLRPKNITIDGSLSSQFLTGLLMAYAASAASNVTITVTNLKSRPYIDLTLKIMRDFGLPVPENKNYEAFYFSGQTTDIQKETIDYVVEGDWSGAAFLLVAGAIAGDIVVKGLDIDSMQADKAVMQALTDARAKMDIDKKEIKIAQSELKAFRFDATDCPDLFPPLVALAAYCAGTTVIKGVGRLAHKESNRALTLQEEFGKLGTTISLRDDEMIIDGKKTLQSAVVHSRHDHRIAMACAVAGLRANGEVVIEEAQAVNKSYPDFYAHLQSLGAAVNIRYSTLNTQ